MIRLFIRLHNWENGEDVRIGNTIFVRYEQIFNSFVLLQYYMFTCTYKPALDYSFFLFYARFYRFSPLVSSGEGR